MILNLQWHRNCFGSAVVIVSVHSSNNTVKPEELPALIERVHETLTGLNEPAVAAGELISLPICRCDLRIGNVRLHRLPGTWQAGERC